LKESEERVKHITLRKLLKERQNAEKLKRSAAKERAVQEKEEVSEGNVEKRVDLVDDVNGMSPEGNQRKRKQDDVCEVDGKRRKFE
jgi:hypothetical protein